MLDSALTVSDVEGVIESVTVQIDVLDGGQEFLADSANAGFSSESGAGFYRLALTAQKTVAEVQAALRNITYEHTSDNPNTSSRNVTYTLIDGTQTTTVTVPLSIVSTNDTITATLSPNFTTYVENDGPRLLFSSVDIQDTDSDTLVEMVVYFTNDDETAGETFAAGSTTISGVTVTPSATNDRLTFSGSASIADYETLLSEVTYQNTDPDLGSFFRSVSVSISDTPTSDQVSTLNFEALGVIDNIIAYASSTPGAVTPTVDHYNALGVSDFFSEHLDDLNAYLLGESVGDVSGLQALISTDDDLDKIPAYIDPDETLYNLHAEHLFSNIVTPYVQAEGDLYPSTALFDISFTAPNGVSHAFTTLMPENSTYPKWEDFRWPNHITQAIRDYVAENAISGVNAGIPSGNDYFSGSSRDRHVIVGATNVQITLVTEWYKLLEYLADQNNPVPTLPEYQAMSMNGVTANNRDAVNANLVSDFNSGVDLSDKNKVETQIGTYDFDQDGVSIALDLDDTDPHTDSDNDGYTDAFETAIGQDPYNSDISAYQMDANDDDVLDVWSDIQDSADARQALIYQAWREAPLILINIFFIKISSQQIKK